MQHDSRYVYTPETRNKHRAIFLSPRFDLSVINVRPRMNARVHSLLGVRDRAFTHGERKNALFPHPRVNGISFRLHQKGDLCIHPPHGGIYDALYLTDASKKPRIWSRRNSFGQSVAIRVILRWGLFMKH